MSKIERKYQMTKIGPGDYILPSNDLARLWRISRYREDGSLAWYEPDDRKWERPHRIIGDFWQAARFRGTAQQGADLIELDVEQFIGWDEWEPWYDQEPTREAAIQKALACAD